MTNHISKQDSVLPSAQSLSPELQACEIHGAFATRGPLTHASESVPGPGPCVGPRVPSRKSLMKKRCYFTHTTKHILPGQLEKPISAMKESHVLTCSMLYPCFSLAMAMYSSTEKQDRRPVNNRGQSAVCEHGTRGWCDRVSGHQAPDNIRKQTVTKKKSEDTIPLCILQTYISQRNG